MTECAGCTQLQEIVVRRIEECTWYRVAIRRALNELVVPQHDSLVLVANAVEILEEVLASREVGKVEG